MTMVALLKWLSQGSVYVNVITLHCQLSLARVEFRWWGGGVGWGGGCKVIFLSNPTHIEVDLGLCWVEVRVLIPGDE